MTQSGIAENFGDALGQLSASRERRENVVFAWSSSLWRDVPMGAIQIAIFECVKTFILNSPAIEIDVNTLQAEAAIGALGGLVGAYVTTPTDVLTTRIITDADGELAGLSVPDVAKRVIDESGPASLFEGSFERSLYWAPAIGIFLACYCNIRQYVAFHVEF